MFVFKLALALALPQRGVEHETNKSTHQPSKPSGALLHEGSPLSAFVESKIDTDPNVSNLEGSPSL